MGFFDKLKQGFQKQVGNVFSAFKKLDDDFYDELEEALILADFGGRTAGTVTGELRALCKKQGVKDGEGARDALRGILLNMLDKGEPGLKLDTKPSVILMVGVNGVGKTTTAGKLALKLKRQGKTAVLAAGDTFRAAAADQLTIWAERSGAQIVKQREGADAASVVFDAAKAAKSRGADVIIVDTAGRLHNKQNLMNELAKISRVLDRELPDSSRETLLVLDATTGQNGLEQARAFTEAAKLTGVVITKLDGTAKGGIAIAVADALGVPVKYAGLGEGAEDLVEFGADEFVRAIV